MIEQLVSEIFPNLSPGQQDAAEALARQTFWESIYERCPQARTEIVNKLRAGRQVVWVSIEGGLASTPERGLEIFRFGRINQFRNDLRYRNATFVWGCAGLSSLSAPDIGHLALDRLVHKGWWDQYASN
jgi:hypothetical protein